MEAEQIKIKRSDTVSTKVFLFSYVNAEKPTIATNPTITKSISLLLLHSRKSDINIPIATQSKPFWHTLSIITGTDVHIFSINGKYVYSIGINFETPKNINEIISVNFRESLFLIKYTAANATIKVFTYQR